MNIQVDLTSSNLASAMLNSKIRPRAVVGLGVKIFHPGPPNYVTRSPGSGHNLKSQHGQKNRKKKGNLLQLSNNLDVSFIFDHLFKRWWLLMPKQNGVKRNGSNITIFISISSWIPVMFLLLILLLSTKNLL